VRQQQVTGFVATAIAYGANGGQKILAVFSVLFDIGVAGSAADPRVIALVIVCFAAGTMLGLRRSAHGLRQGVLHPKPYQVACTLWASTSAVLLGSVLAAPMSMTQSVTGALIGTAPPREWRRLRWEQSRRIVLVRRAYQDGLAQIFDGELSMDTLKTGELLRRLDVLGLRLAEGADAHLDGLIKRAI
jgi:phosphate/sulfate permease